MPIDNAKNGARATLAEGITAGATSIALASGHGARMPSVPFNAWIYNATDYAADPHDDPGYEVVRVTAQSTDTLSTVIRAQESTAASAHNAAGKTYKLVAGLTARTISDELAPFVGLGTYTIASFGASGSAVTTTGSINAASTSLTVASASSFAVGQGIYVAGAGAAGVPLITTITAIAGSTITLAAAASLSVSGALVQHDDTAAIQAALNLITTVHHLTLIFDSAFYRVNGPINTATDSILTVPYDTGFVDGRPRVLRMFGQSTMVGDVTWSPSQSGTIIQSDKIGVPSAGGWLNTSILNCKAPYLGNSFGELFYLISLVTVHIKDMVFRTYDNPQLCGLDLLMCWNAILENVNVDTGVSPEGSTDFGGTTPPASEPTHGAFGLRLPRNTTVCQTSNVNVTCYHYGIIYSDVWTSINTMVLRCKVGLHTRGHDYPATGTLLIVQCPTGIQIEGSIGFGRPGLDCHIRFEVDGLAAGRWWTQLPNRFIYDPTDVLFGYIKYIIVRGGVGGPGEAITVTGCTNLSKTNIWT